MRITLKTLPDATPQQVFDQVKNHLLTQNEQSLFAPGDCVYRNDEGLSCAAGCLMSNEEYRHDFENVTWRKLANTGRVPKAHIDLIEGLQNIHDGNLPEVWGRCLKAFAEQHDLNY